MKKILKKIPGFNKLNKIRKNYEFTNDRKFFNNNYMYSKIRTKEKIEYDMLFEIHKLEKGFAVTNNIRPFGIDKVKKIIEDIKEFEKHNYKKSFSYNLSYSALDEYLKYYEKNNWIDLDEYKYVKKFMNNKKDYEYIKVGAFDYKKEDFIEIAKSFDYDKFIETRRSIRNFSNKKLNEEDIEKAVLSAIKTPTACNRQMCKIYYIDNKKNKKVIEKYAQGLSLFELENANYFVITFDISANYFIGERNQGWFNAGLVSMNFINALHSLGIGSCCIQFANSYKEEQEFKEKLDIPSNERVALILTAGYYDEISRIPFSSRKPIDEIYRIR